MTDLKLLKLDISLNKLPFQITEFEQLKLIKAWAGNRQFSGLISSVVGCIFFYWMYVFEQLHRLDRVGINWHPLNFQ